MLAAGNLAAMAGSNAVLHAMDVTVQLDENGMH